MSSTAGPGTAVQGRAELLGTLEEIGATVERLRALLATQRAAVAAANLGRLLATLDEQEAASARLAHLEGQRQELQRALEHDLGVVGLGAVLGGGGGDRGTSDGVNELLARLAASVARLRRDQAQALGLLGAAAATAARTRAYLVQLAGATPAYGPALRVKAAALG